MHSTPHTGAEKGTAKWLCLLFFIKNNAYGVPSPGILKIKEEKKNFCLGRSAEAADRGSGQIEAQSGGNRLKKALPKGQKQPVRTGVCKIQPLHFVLLTQFFGEHLKFLQIYAKMSTSQQCILHHDPASILYRFADALHTPHGDSNPLATISSKWSLWSLSIDFKYGIKYWMYSTPLTGTETTGHTPGSSGT